MKLNLIYISLLSAALFILVFAAFQVEEADELKSNKSIIKFSHSLHKDLAECETCHSGAAASKTLKDRLFPDHDNCSECHDVENDNECKTCHYEENYEALQQEEPDLFFDHSFHLTEQELSCESCHKGISEVDYAEDAVQPNPIMEDCYSCHSSYTRRDISGKDLSVASNACEACHVSTAHLLPQSHKNVSFIRTHKFAARAFDANCIMCHENISNSCEDCHLATNVVTELNLPDNFYQPYAPRLFSDGARKQQITRVHELGYRFTHGIDARIQTFECQSCHEIETFCAECHQSENSDFAMGGITPVSHFQPGFTTAPIPGSGGGEHAVLAKRDIESCAACHDVNGADPTCSSMCHQDSDGIKGTNPKTHKTNFMRDVEGDWHNDQGSICYNCHTSAGPSSPPTHGFCNYCHGGF